MASLAELHGGSIMYNLFQRYKRNQIYVSCTCSSLGQQGSSVCLPNLREPQYPSPALHTPQKEAPQLGVGFFFFTFKEYSLTFERLLLISEKLSFLKFCQVRNLREKKLFLLNFLLMGSQQFEMARPPASCEATHCVLLLSVLLCKEIIQDPLPSSIKDMPVPPSKLLYRSFEFFWFCEIFCGHFCLQGPSQR